MIAKIGWQGEGALVLSLRLLRIARSLSFIHTMILANKTKLDCKMVSQTHPKLQL